MSDSPFEISSFQSNNFAEIVALNATTYPGHEIADERYLFWEYEMNPDGKAIIHVAKKDKLTVAQYAVIPRRFTYNGKMLNGSVSVNTITHPSFRGKGFFPRLANETYKQCAERNILFTIGFPNPVSLPVIRKRNILTIAGSLSVLFKPLNPLSSAMSYLKSRKEKSGGEIPLSMPEFLNPDIDSFDIASSFEGYNKLLTKFNNGIQITTYRNIDFFKWRYSDIPRRTYYSLKHGQDEVKAVIVFRAKYIYGIRCMVIVDIIAVDQNAVAGLLAEVKRIAKNNDIQLMISAITPHAEEFSTMKSAGYFSIPDFLLPQKLTFIVRKHKDECPDDVMNFEKWYLTFGDYDIF